MSGLRAFNGEKYDQIYVPTQLVVDHTYTETTHNIYFFLVPFLFPAAVKSQTKHLQ